MDASELIDALGGSAEVSRLLGGVGPFAVGNWRKRGIPAWAVPEMQRVCDERGITVGEALKTQPPRRAKERVA